MNKDQADGNWKQLKGKVKEKWGKLTDDDLTVIEGKREQLVGKIQERYGYQKEAAEKEVKALGRSHQTPLVICRAAIEGSLPSAGRRRSHPLAPRPQVQGST